MILEFSVGNFRSISEMQTISLQAANIKSRNQQLDETNLHKITDDLSLVKSVALYGANGSGKSNVIKAMLTMFQIIKYAMSRDNALMANFDPFMLNPTQRNEASFFQIQFIVNQKKYRYGFEATSREVVSEWLFGPAQKNETYYFQREGQNIKINEKHFSEGSGLDSKTSETNLFLNVVNAFNGPISKELKHFFSYGIAINSGLYDESFRHFTLERMKEKEGGEQILKLLNWADLGIEDIIHEDPAPMPEGPFQKVLPIHEPRGGRVYSSRPVYNDSGEMVEKIAFELDYNESEGTIKMFNLAGMLLRVLSDGMALIVDEFDARLHPLLTKKIVEMFNSKELNTKGAQLFFVTHDTNLLDKELLRRDQIYFAEKDSKGRTVFYSLYDFKGVRNDASYEKDYIKGKYGAIPFLGDFKTLLDV